MLDASGPRPYNRSMGEVVPRQELEAAVHAHRELGPEYEDAVVDAIVDKIERRLDERVRPGKPRKHVNLQEMALGSLAIAIPIFAIGAWTAGLTGLVVVAVAVVLLNLVVYLADR